MLGTGQGGEECCGKAIGEVNPSTLGKTTSLKYTVVVVVSSLALVTSRSLARGVVDAWLCCVRAYATQFHVKRIF